MAGLFALQACKFGARRVYAIESNDGINVWFDTTLAEDVGFSNAPSAQELIYGTAFFPWPPPVPLAAGDVVSIVLQGRPRR